MARRAEIPDVLVPTARTPGQFARPGIESRAGQEALRVGRGVQRIAGAIATIAIEKERERVRLAEDVLKMQDADEAAIIVALVSNELEAMKNLYETNSDFTVYEPEWGKSEAKIKDAIGGVTREGERNRLSNWYTEMLPIWRGKVTAKVQNGIEIKTRADTLIAVESLITADLRDDARAASNIEKGVIVSEREVKLARISELIESANVKGGIWNPEELRILETQIEKRLDTYQKARDKAEIETVVWQAATSIVREDGEVDWQAAERWFSVPENVEGIPEDIFEDLSDTARSEASAQKVRDKETLNLQRELDRGTIYDAIETGQYKLPDGTISTDIRSLIESSSLDEDEQAAKWESSKKETDRKLKGEEIVTDSKQRSQFYKDNMGILTGAVERDILLAEVQTARFGDYSDPSKPIKPSLNEKHYAPLITTINAQYEQGFGQMMSRVNTYAEGILLNPDSLGFIKNAPIRHKILGDFQEAWMTWIAEQGEKLKLSNIYPEGRRIAASYQVSDQEAERQETLMTKELEAKEQGRPKIEQRTEGETIQEYLKRTGK